MALAKEKALKAIVVLIIIIGFVIPSIIFITQELNYEASEYQVIDKNATNATINLFNNLADVSDKKVLFGHQETTMLGIDKNGSSWHYNLNRSDVKTLTGSFPAVYGFDIGGISNEDWKELSRFEHQPDHIKAAFARGGVITISWHAKNYVTGGDFYDTNGSVVPKIIPGGELHDTYKSALDHVAEALGNLTYQDQVIPMIFRPWHENNGGWFWWGSPYCTAEEFKKLFRFTVTYLRDTKNVHNFLYSYSPNMPLFSFTKEDYLARYPGDQYIDIIGMDAYDDSGYSMNIPLLTSWEFRLKSSLRLVVNLARSRGKIAALTETGFHGGLNQADNPNWFTEVLLDAIKGDKMAKKIAYVLTWANHHYESPWIPYPGHQNAEDFKQFFANDLTVFQDTLPEMYDECEIKASALTDGFFVNSVFFLFNGLFFGFIALTMIKKYFMSNKPIPPEVKKR
ncbi:MAG: glycoside hydrolase family 26 protein [Promethearchaeia archaeon]